MQINALPALESLPPLRQELAIHPAQDDNNGAPTWNLHDPINNQFYQLAWPAFEILSRWHLGNVNNLLTAVNAETTLAVTQTDIEAVFQFLARHNLMQANQAQDSARLAQTANLQRMSKPMWLLKHYLFFRVPLVRPSAFLQAMLPRIQWIFTRQFWYSIAAIALLGLYLVSQQWDTFTHTFAAYSNWQGLLAIGIALSLAKVLHELGHAFTAYRYGCRVPHMGVAFMVMVPMLYTDTNEAWKLQSRRQRMHIGVAGMAAEIALAACATLAWSFLPDGSLRASVFLLATSTWLITLAINTSPFMRFDGYFLMSDWLNLPNLHERSFALARWHMREFLFGFGTLPPEKLPNQNAIIGFAYFTWVYRLILFLGIAFLVYYLFFKLLGIVLLAVELGWFIAYPVWREIKQWWAMREKMRFNFNSLRSIGLLLAVIAILCVPWQRGINAPAVLGAEQAKWFYAPAAAQVLQVDVKIGQTIAQNTPMLRLSSPELQHQLGLAQARLQAKQWQVDQQNFDENLLKRGGALSQQLESAQAEVAGLQAQIKQLNLQADFAGKVVDINPALKPQAWLAGGERLLQMAGTQGVKLEAFVNETDVANIKPQDKATFIADNSSLAEVNCVVESVDRIALSALEQAALSSPYGGEIAAKLNAQSQPEPLEPHFKVRLSQCKGIDHVAQEYIGKVHIGSNQQSFAGKWLRRFLAVLQREGGL